MYKQGCVVILPSPTSRIRPTSVLRIQEEYKAAVLLQLVAREADAAARKGAKRVSMRVGRGAFIEKAVDLEGIIELLKTLLA